ncbi:hypothetical protein M3194_24895 [Paenibacillus glycanilyticus]|uniref:hypothetical protein n=1 Tax=Paenibacillus glycanilyticus TaxID=126569 RepID=UPI002041E56F|nr:hypothetical protein [Paenibacillus glycanilyticus]MCM3630575.1 hypothetical protein [Paenibacillus glycanilyticus]
MAEFIWDSIENIYSPLEEQLQNGMTLEIIMICNESLEGLNATILNDLFRTWTYGYNGRYINPFKLLEFKSFENYIKAQVKIKNKNKEVDELRLFIQDLLHFLNSDDIHITNLGLKIMQE